MKEYKVSPTWKKSIYDTSYYVSDDKTIYFESESTWRWGDTILALTAEQVAEIEQDECLSLDDYEGGYDNLNLDDQCSFQISVGRGTIDDLLKLYTEEEQQELRIDFFDNEVEDLQQALDYLYEQEGYELFERFNNIGYDVVFQCAINFEEI